MKNAGRMTMHDLARVAPTWSFGSALQQPTQPEYDRPLVLLNNLQQEREEDQRMRVPSALTARCGTRGDSLASTTLSLSLSLQLTHLETEE